MTKMPAFIRKRLAKPAYILTAWVNIPDLHRFDFKFRDCLSDAEKQYHERVPAEVRKIVASYVHQWRDHRKDVSVVRIDFYHGHGIYLLDDHRSEIDYKHRFRMVAFSSPEKPRLEIHYIDGSTNKLGTFHRFM